MNIDLDKVPFLNSVINHVPIVGSLYGLANTASKVYNSTTVVGAMESAAHGIIVNCTPPVIKTPLLCTYLLASGCIAVSTGGNPLAITSVINTGRMIVEKNNA